MVKLKKIKDSLIKCEDLKKKNSSDNFTKYYLKEDVYERVLLKKMLTLKQNNYPNLNLIQIHFSSQINKYLATCAILFQNQLR